MQTGIRSLEAASIPKKNAWKLLFGYPKNDVDEIKLLDPYWVPNLIRAASSMHLATL